MGFCKCGCGKKSRVGRSNYKIMGNKNPAKRLEVRKKISKALKGREHPWMKGDKHPMKRLEMRQKMSRLLKGRPHPWQKGDKHPMKRWEVRRKVSKALKGRKCPWCKGDKNPAKRPEVRRKISINNPMRRLEIRKKFIGNKNPMRRPEVRMKVSKALKGRKHSKETIKKISKALKGRKFSDSTIKKILNSLMKRPTGYEKIIIGLIEKYNLPYKYVGDGKVMIDYQNPDFIQSNGEKKLIEVYHEYFKIRNFGSVKRYEDQRRKRFAKFGFKTLFLKDEDMMKGEEWLLNKIRRF